MSAVDDARAKERRQKIIVAVGGVLLVGLLLIQGPKMLKRLGGDAAAAPPTTEEVSPAPTPAEPQASASGAGSQSLAAVLVAERRVVRSPERLYAFDRFADKDPFAEPGAQVQREPVTRSAPTKPSRRTPARRVRFTVIVHSLPVSFGRKRAQSLAREVSIRLGRRARVLRSSTQRSLLPGYWVVHIGSYPTRAAAAPALRAARRVNRRAYIRHIRVRV